MDRYSSVYQWQHELKQHLTKLTAPQAKELAIWSLAVVQANRATLSAVLLQVSVWRGVKPDTARKRLKDFYLPKERKKGQDRRELDPKECFADLLRWVLALLPGKHLVLALDASNQKDKMIVLCLSVVLEGCAVPVAWHLVGADQKGKWSEHWIALLRRIAPAVPADREVLVLADRGVWGQWLYRAVCERGWHCLLRVNDKCAPLFRSGSGRHWQKLSDLPVLPGREHCRKVELFKRQPLPCYLIGFRGQDAKEPWYLVTDWQQIGGAAYAQRFWIECSFKSIKSGGFDWERTRISEPDRMARLWLVYGVSLLLSLCWGRQAEAQCLGQGLLRRRLSGCLVRAVSLFRRGRAVVERLIVSGRALFCPIFACHIWGNLPIRDNTARKPPPVRGKGVGVCLQGAGVDVWMNRETPRSPLARNAYFAADPRVALRRIPTVCRFVSRIGTTMSHLGRSVISTRPKA